MNTTSSVSEVFQNTNPIANRIENKEVKSNRLLDKTSVDFLLQDYAELIDVRYTKWFAKRFYNMPFDVIHRCASEAKQDGKDSRRLFAFLINKNHDRA